MPICLGYLAVSFTLGITARNAGMTAWQAMLTSLACNASAGQYAGFTVIAAGGTYFEMVLMELVANARYLLMSCSLSQKFSSETGLLHRLLVGFDVTDEIFGVAVSEPGKLNPFYNYGMMTVAIPGWSLGTFFGVIMGNILPANIVSALSGHYLHGFQLYLLTASGDFRHFLRYPHHYSHGGNRRHRSNPVPGKGGNRTCSIISTSTFWSCLP